jgi:hypothetical protein
MQSKANNANKKKFLDEAKKFLASTESKFESKDSHNMKQLQLSMIELAKVYTNDMKNLDQ